MTFNLHLLSMLCNKVYHEYLQRWHCISRLFPMNGIAECFSVMKVSGCICSKGFKGAVHWYYFDVKPFNLAACFITKCDAKCYDTCIKMAGQGQQCTIKYELYWCFSWHTTSVLVGENAEKSFICGRTVKLNGQNEMFARVLGMGHH